MRCQIKLTQLYCDQITFTLHLRELFILIRSFEMLCKKALFSHSDGFTDRYFKIQASEQVPKFETARAWGHGPVPHTNRFSEARRSSMPCICADANT